MRWASQSVIAFSIHGEGGFALEHLPYLNTILLLYERQGTPGSPNPALWHQKQPHGVVALAPEEPVLFPSLQYSLAALVPQHGKGGESTQHAEGFLGQDSCSLGDRCIPAALCTPLTLPGSARVWGRSLGHGKHSQLEGEKSLHCWIRSHAPISVQGRCEERACSCPQICHLPLITYDQLIFYPLLYVAWHWETIMDLMLIHK